MDGRRWLTSLLMLALLLGACAAPAEKAATAEPTGTAAAGASPPIGPVYATPSAALEATASPSPLPVALSPSSSPSPVPTAGASATSPPTGPTLPAPGPDGWIGPLRVSTRDYEGLSLVVDTRGVAHAAAELNDGIFYLTNASGSWTRERLSTPPAGGSDREPSLAYDPDEGYLAVAFTRYSRYRCEELGCFPSDSIGIHVATNYGKGWNAPFQVTTGNDYLPALVTGVGQLHLAYERSTPSTTVVRHATDSGLGPEWFDARVAEGGGPGLAVGSDGRPRVVFSDEEIFYALGGSTDGVPWDVQPVAGLQGWPELLLDSADRPHVIYTSWDDPWSIMHTSLGSGGWSTPDLVVSDEIAGDVAIDDEDGLHLVYDVIDAAEPDLGLYYATNRSGTWATRQVDNSTRAVADGPVAASAIALDAAGRVHILFMVPYDEGRIGLYYAVGPTD
jgi:hypothetical protein